MLLLPRVALADTDRDRATARSAADAGADAFDQGQYQQALELFGRAEQLVHAPPHLLFMARSLAKLGRLVEAHETYLKIVNEQLPANAPKAFKSARAQAEDEISGVEARIAHVTVAVRGPDASRAVLSIDHTDVPAAEQGIPIPMDPGTHVFSARSGQARSEEKTVTLRDGGRESIELTLPESAPSAVGAPLAAIPSAAAVEPNGSKPDAATSGRKHAGRRIIAYSALGLGAVGLGVGTYFLVSSINTRHKADDAYVCNGEADCTGDETNLVHQYDHEADHSRNWAIGTYAAGVACIGTGLILLMTEPKASRQASLSTVDVRVVPGLGTLHVIGHF